MCVEPEQPNCDEFKHPIRGRQLDEYVYKNYKINVGINTFHVMNLGVLLKLLE